MRRRKWCYVMKPSQYEMTCDKCGGTNIQWSEYEGMIWCYKCQIDTRGNSGIFDGPIPMGISKLLGISFARFYPDENVVRYPVLRKNKLVYTKKRPDDEPEFIVQKRKD